MDIQGLHPSLWYRWNIFGFYGNRGNPSNLKEIAKHIEAAETRQPSRPADVFRVCMCGGEPRGEGQSESLS